MMPEKEIITSPKGEALYPYVDRPDKRYDKDGVYHLYLLLDPANKEHKDFLNYLYKLTPQNGRPPYKKHTDPETGQETGLYVVHAKSKFRPNIFDAKGNLIEEPVNLGSGSIVKIAFISNVYDGFGGGLNLYLQAVQIFKLVEYEGPSAERYGFEPESDGFEYSGQQSPFDENVPEQAQAMMNKAEAEKEDDLPF